MRKLFLPLFVLVAVAAVGCDGPKVTGSTAPLSDEEKRKIAEQDQQTNSEESPGNKTQKARKK